MSGPDANDVALQRFVHNIQKTGFILEFNVSRLLGSHGWIVVNNKYYLDDVTGNARELDLLAYKVSTCQSIRIYTTLLISCKKSEEHAWALISKQKNERDPNTEWFPISVWSNDPILNFMLTQSKTDWKTRYVDSSGPLYDSLLCPESHIFAFQEMHKKTGVRNDDKRIFSSITSLMKAQAYEMGSLAERRKEPSLYNFNLIGVVETALIEITLNDGVSANEIIDAKYVGGYIIDRREATARVHIVRFDAVDSVLANYDRLHIHNCDVFSRLHESFFDSVMEDYGRVEVLLGVFREKVKWTLYNRLKESGWIGNYDDVSPGLLWNEKEQKVEVWVIDSDRFTQILNTDDKCITEVRAALKEVYRFSGDIVFTRYPF